jgi:hypothetical protein
VEEMVAAGSALSTACRVVAAEQGVRRRALYEAATTRRRGGG